MLVVTCGCSRFTVGRIVPTRRTPELHGTWALAWGLGRVLRRLTWDSERGDGRRTVTGPVGVFVGALTTKEVLLLPLLDLEATGLVKVCDKVDEACSPLRPVVGRSG